MSSPPLVTSESLVVLNLNVDHDFYYAYKEDQVKWSQNRTDWTPQSKESISKTSLRSPPPNTAAREFLFSPPTSTIIKQPPIDIEEFLDTPPRQSGCENFDIRPTYFDLTQDDEFSQDELPSQTPNDSLTNQDGQIAPKFDWQTEISVLSSQIEAMSLDRVGILHSIEEKLAIHLGPVKRDRLTKLTDEEEMKVSKAIRSRNTDILVSAFDIDISGEDIKTLSGCNWLNDNVINFFFKLLEKSNQQKMNASKCHLFNTYFYACIIQGAKGYDYSRVRRWTRTVDLMSMDKVIVPLHLGVHWALAVINLKEKKFEYIDSMRGSGLTHLQKLKRYIVDEIKDKKKIDLNVDDWPCQVRSEVPQQRNGFDCGVFMSTFVDCLVNDDPFDFSQKDMPHLRKRMILSILNCSLVG